jgi:hypothetical protein
MSDTKYPLLVFVGPQAMDAQAIADTSTKIDSQDTNQEFTYRTSDHVAYFAYPESYNKVINVFDVNGNNVNDDFTSRYIDLQVDGENQSYVVLEHKNVIDGEMTYRFKNS